jgi:hypothetical protein
MTRNRPLTWVGVARFEPAASSSRSQRTMRCTTGLPLSDLACTVRGRPRASAGIGGRCYSVSYSPGCLLCHGWSGGDRLWPYLRRSFDVPP